MSEVPLYVGRCAWGPQWRRTLRRGTSPQVCVCVCVCVVCVCVCERERERVCVRPTCGQQHPHSRAAAFPGTQMQRAFSQLVPRRHSRSRIQKHAHDAVVVSLRGAHKRRASLVVYHLVQT